jgi:hypothetical protein
MTKPRSRIRYEGVWYKPVPWLKESDCHGCAMNETRKLTTTACYNQSTPNVEPCSTGSEFDGYVFIRCGKEGLAEYIAAKLEGSDD